MESTVNSEAKNPGTQTEAERHLEQAYIYKDNCDYARVLRECDAAIEINPSLVEAHNLRGISLEELGKPEEAHKAYKQAVSLDPDFHEAKSNLELFEQDLAEKYQLVTIAAYNTAIEANISKNILHSEGIWSFICGPRGGYASLPHTSGFGLVRLQVRKPDAERACEALDIKPEDTEELGDEADEDEDEGEDEEDLQEPVSCAERKADSEAKSPEPQTEAGRHLEQAHVCKDNCDYVRLLRECDAAIKLDPSLDEAYYLKGVALGELGHEDEAVEAYRHAVSLNPSSAEAKAKLSRLEGGLEKERKLVTIAVYAHAAEDDKAKKILDSAGIWSATHWIKRGATGMYFSDLVVVRLQVKPLDADRALELLNEKPEGVEDSDDEPIEHETHEEHIEPPVSGSPIVRYEKSRSPLSFFKKRKRDSE